MMKDSNHEYASCFTYFTSHKRGGPGLPAEAPGMILKTHQLISCTNTLKHDRMGTCDTFASVCSKFFNAQRHDRLPRNTSSHRQASEHIICRIIASGKPAQEHAQRDSPL